MTEIKVTTWQQRLERMDHTRGTSNKMIQAAMIAEIGALREALAEARRARKVWKTVAVRYRKTLLEWKRAHA